MINALSIFNVENTVSMYIAPIVLVIVPFPIACGHCFYCEHQEFSQCDNTNEYGEAGGLFGYSKSYGNYAGGQAEYLRVPHANVGPVKVPEELTDE